MLSGCGSVTIPANSKEIVELSAGELTTGFLKLAFSGGAGAELKLLQAESYYLPAGDDKWIKRDRTDSTNGQLQGMSDTYHVSGFGSVACPETYEPFWFRTFRFLQLEITTQAQPLTLSDISYLETGYPLEIKTSVKTSDETLAPIWNISQRTLRRCMHETYMDCPFYEQMQYVMDTRAQILYTYAVSADDRLARKCFADFQRSQRYDGMIACCYPSTGFSVIPSFAIYYILMIHDHMMYFGDKKLVRTYLPTIDAILGYFDNHLASNGLVDKLGGRLFVEPSWSFIDWSPAWDASSGIPPAGLHGPSTMESLLYIMGLDHAAELAEFAGRNDTGAKYRARAERLRQAVRTCCIGKNGMLQDGPGIDEYSQHGQVFAVLTDTVSGNQARENLRRTMEQKDSYAQCTVAMAYYLFRALEKCGLYDYTAQCWDVWRDMVKNNLTTCVEEPLHQRSDCHAWGALALYELPAVILGVRPTKPGFADFEVRPVPGHLTWAEGNVITPKGMILVRWKRVEDTLEVDASWQSDKEDKS